MSNSVDSVRVVKTYRERRRFVIEGRVRVAAATHEDASSQSFSEINVQKNGGRCYRTGGGISTTSSSRSSLWTAIKCQRASVAAINAVLCVERLKVRVGQTSGSVFDSTSSWVRFKWRESMILIDAHKIVANR